MSRPVEFERARNAYMLASERYLNAVEWEIYVADNLCSSAARKVRAMAAGQFTDCLFMVRIIT